MVLLWRRHVGDRPPGLGIGRPGTTAVSWSLIPGRPGWRELSRGTWPAFPRASSNAPGIWARPTSFGASKLGMMKAELALRSERPLASSGLLLTCRALTPQKRCPCPYSKPRKCHDPGKVDMPVKHPQGAPVNSTLFHCAKASLTQDGGGEPGVRQGTKVPSTLLGSTCRGTATCTTPRDSAV